MERPLSWGRGTRGQVLLHLYRLGWPKAGRRGHQAIAKVLEHLNPTA